MKRGENSVKNKDSNKDSNKDKNNHTNDNDTNGNNYSDKTAGKSAQHTGISRHHAEELLQTYGPNELKNIKKISALSILLHQIKTNHVIYLLLASFIIALTVGKTTTAFTIIIVIFIVITVGFVQEYKAEKSIDALKNMITSTATVIRDNKEQSIPTKLLVPEDIIILRSGDRIPADCIVLEEKELKLNESMLTGESKELYKKAFIGTDFKKATDENMIFMGTFIISGKCIARVLHTGMNTRFGNIANMISTAEKELPLQKKVNNIVRYMVIIGATLSIIAGIIMLFSQPQITYDTFVEALMVVLALSIASFPEGFPVVLITTLAYGAYRMAKKNAIINRMSIIETLGETTVICSDKTGTITTGEMTVKKILVDNKMFDVSGAGYSVDGEIMLNGKKIVVNKSETPTIYSMLRASVLCNDSRIEHAKEDKYYNIYGSPTEASLLIMAAKTKMYREDITHTRIAELPFNSERKMMSVLVEYTRKMKSYKTIFSKGAPEKIIKACDYIMIDGEKKSLTSRESTIVLKRIQELNKSSYRAMALAYKDLKSSHNTKDSMKIAHSMEHGLTLLGIVFIEDPPRPEVKESIKICQDAGISVKMITGDSKETAEAIAAEIGLSGKTTSGEDMDILTDDELSKIVKDIVIFYRVRPEHKLRIVHALKTNGEIVAMTGDGVNDAPALKEAHIGVAMGKNGTDVSREASDLILKDDNFSTIVDAIREGRTIFNNIQKFTVYQTSINFTQVMLILLSLAFGLPLPLIALQILFMNILSDEVTAVTLSFNSYSKDVMDQPPRRKADSQIITKHSLSFMIFSGIIMTLSAIGIFYYVIDILHASLRDARTVVFATMTLFAVANAYNFRSFRKLVINRSILSNKYLFYASIFSIMSTILLIYSPLNTIFELAPIGINLWSIGLGLSIMLILMFDTMKILNNKYHLIEKITQFSTSEQIKK
ncbi:MAG: cation-translocating P-type ATPase [Candidatus Woesearchaeota archaeon]